jgi:VWFA-related protein
MTTMRTTFLLPVLFFAAALAEPQEATFKVNSNLVTVNVEVKDRAGKPVESLKASDFEVLENGKPQRVAVFEFQRLEKDAPAPTGTAVIVENNPNAPAPKPEAAAPTGAAIISASKPGELRYRDRRLIALYFDLTSMGVPEQIRARRAAEEYVRTKMTPSDLVAVLALSSQLKVLQDFTGDRDLLFETIKKIRVGESTDLAETTATDEEVEDTGAAFTADTSEFDIFNTDRKLSALQDAVDMLASLPEKKALVYFSSGVGRSGTENESQLRSTVNAAIRANVAFYPIDTRGLVAEAPAGDASVGAMRGSALFSGKAQRQRRERANAQQDTLYTLAADTGGKALLDSNDLAEGIVQAQQDFSSYYILGYYSSDASEDGKYRRVQVRITSPEKLKLEYRAGYFAPKTFDKYTDADKERQLEEALRLGDPVTDLPVALEVLYFRRAKDRYIIPVAVKIPGSAIPFVKRKGNEQAQLDFIAEIRDKSGRPAATVRDFIRIRLDQQNASQLAERLLHYDTAFTLPPGEYKIKFVVRENQGGKLGTFETKFTIPDLTLDQPYLRTSSVVWGNQRVPLNAAVGVAEKKNKLAKTHPLVRDNQKLIPSITKVVRDGQQLYVLFEVYEPGETPEKGIDIEANVTLFGRKGKAVSSEPVIVTTRANDKAVSIPIELRVPIERLPAGSYTCQLSIIDKAAGKFAFQRTPLVILPKAAAATPAVTP